MTVEHVAKILESWAPKWIAWERDNVGLQVGYLHQKVSRILVALDVTEKIITEAATRRADLIISHHPLLFRPPRTITSADSVGKLVLLLAEKRISLYSAHTNLDFTKGGVSFELGRALGLTNIRFLAPLKDLFAKVVVFVPATHVDKVREAMAGAGAGIIGEYESCSFGIEGTGTFRGSSETKPYVGSSGRFETVREIRLEMIAPRAAVESTVRAMKSAHPYEEMAYDIYPVENPSPNYGAGAIGEIRKPLSLAEFLTRAKKVLRTESLRVSGNLKSTVKTVAVCGGSGSDLLPAALAAQADVFLTADINYHTFHSSHGTMALVDAGHWETEHLILPRIRQELEKAIHHAAEHVQVFVTKYSTNPAQHF
jgi:dinuclear metal center YbgI/SA1388 family protein